MPRIALNVFPLASSEFSFLLYRLPNSDGSRPSVADEHPVRRSLCVDGIRDHYWTLFQKVENAVPTTCGAMDNRYATIEALRLALFSSCQQTLAVNDFRLVGRFRRMFDETLDDDHSLLLYKLHGSLDWYFRDGQVLYSDSTSVISDHEVALIFGTSYKLTYLDPFLFFVYELRRWTLDAARLIVCVGYGFSDEHINGILGQALRQNPDRKLLAVTGPREENAAKKVIAARLAVQEPQVLVNTTKASEFFQKDLSIAALAGLFPIEDDLLPEKPSATEGNDLTDVS